MNTIEKDRLWYRVDGRVEIFVTDLLGELVWHHVRDQVGERVGSKVWDRVVAQVSNSVEEV